MGVVRGVPRRTRRAPVRDRPRRTGGPRPGQGLRDGRPRRRQRGADGRRHRCDVGDRRARPARRRARVLDLAYADPQVEVRRTRSRHARDRRRAVRARGCAPTSRPRRVPVRARPCAGPSRRVAVDDRDGPPYRADRERQPESTRRGAGSLAGGAGAARSGSGRRRPDRRPGRRPQRRTADVPGGQLQPARLPSRLCPDLGPSPRRACRCPARAGVPRPPRRVTRPRQPLRAGGDIAPRPVVGSRRRRHRLRTARRGLDWRSRRPHGPPGNRVDRRPTDRPRRHTG